MRKNQTSVLAIASLTVMLVVGMSISFPIKAHAQTSSNATSAKNDSFERLFAKAPPKMATSGMQANNYSAWLIICNQPPITNAETQCDVPTQLH
jgi:invasion protein IalB